MTHLELKQAILEYMRDCLQVEFIGRIDIQDIEPEGYKVSFNLDNSENPVVIIADLPDCEFLSFIKEELRSRKFHKQKHFKAVKLCPRMI